MTAKVRAKRNDGQAPVAIDDATEVYAGELLFLDTDDAKPASSQADQGSESANQLLFAQKFLGAAAGSKLAAETWRDSILVDFNPLTEREYDCASETHEIGDLMGVDENSDGNGLLNTTLVKVTDPSRAIAECVRKDAAASTTCRVRFIRSVLWANPTDLRLAPITQTLAGDLVLTKFSPRVLVLDPAGARDVRLPPEADMAGAFIFLANAADAAEDITVTDDGDTATVATISQNQVGFFFCDGTKWYGGMGPQT